MRFLTLIENVRLKNSPLAHRNRTKREIYNYLKKKDFTQFKGLLILMDKGKYKSSVYKLNKARKATRE